MQTTDTPIYKKTIVNFRDLHGLKTQDNASIRLGRLYRSANPSWASDEDMAYLKTLELTHIVDFRSEQEKKQAKEACFNQAFPCIAKPIELGDLISKKILQKIKTLDQEDVHDYMCDLYRLFVTDYQQPFASFLQLAEKGQTLLYHCTAGQDRTGFASLLLLSALGVDEDTIMANFLESNLYTKEIFHDSDEHARQLGIDLEIYKLFQIVTPDYLYSAQKLINQDFGGMQHYLQDVLQVDINTIRNHYLE